MKVAIIDLGTNTFHLLIAEVTKDDYHIVLRTRKAVKIGEKGINKGQITEEASARALEALKEFRATIDEMGIETIFATATSAMRNAKNGKELAAAIEKETGIKIEIISGSREAELIHLGASKALDFGQEKNLIIDIGGGSIEFIIADQDKIYWLQSFEIGGQRLVELFHKSDPIAQEDIQGIYKYLDTELQPLKKAYQEHKPQTLIGCSGTFDTLSDIYCAENGIDQDENATELPFGKGAFQDIYADLIGKNRKERLEIPGMIEMRVDMIVVASILLKYLDENLHLNRMRVSAYALKEGILFGTLDKLRKSNTPA